MQNSYFLLISKNVSKYHHFRFESISIYIMNFEEKKLYFNKTNKKFNDFSIQFNLYKFINTRTKLLETAALSKPCIHSSSRFKFLLIHCFFVHTVQIIVSFFFFFLKHPVHKYTINVISDNVTTTNTSMKLSQIMQ